MCTVDGMDKTMGLREVRDSLGIRVDAARYTDENTIITRAGKPHAVIVSWSAYQQLKDGVVDQDSGADLGQTSVGHRRTPSDTTDVETPVGQHEPRSSSDHVGYRRKN